jgi:hypothetical protein
MISKGAIFSPDRKFRYNLWRSWDTSRPVVTFVCLNPSTADENVDDPTVRRCINFALHWKYGGMNMMNTFALRSTDPLELTINKAAALGPENDNYLREIIGPVVVAWGNWGRLYGRSEEMRHILGEASCFGLTKLREPRHPLYLHHSTELIPWQGAR